MQDEKPWKWGEAGKVMVITKDGPRELTLVATDTKRVAHFDRQLAIANGVTQTLFKAKQAFESGQAEYTSAVRRLKKLLDEWDKASDELYEVALGVSQFFMEKGLEEIFGRNDVEALAVFAGEAIDKLAEAAIAAEVKKAAPKVEPRAPEPEALSEKVPNDGQLVETAESKG